MKSLRSLIITTSNNKLDDTTNKTGVWLEDLAVPYFILKDGGEFITIASPKGGQIPLDPNSETNAAATETTHRFQESSQAMYHFAHAIPLSEVKAEDYDLVFIAGGYGAMWDFPDNINLKQIISDFYFQNKPIALVGHAVVALVSLSINSEEPFVKDRKLTAFSNSEEVAIGLNEKPPFLLESKLMSLGALYNKGIDFESHVVIDGNIITGQNPASSTETAKQLLFMAHQQINN